MLRDRRNSNLCDSETQENTYLSEVRGKKERIRLTNDNLEQNNKGVEVVAHCYGMVKIPLAEPWYTN
jgi:hypothetical protein